MHRLRITAVAFLLVSTPGAHRALAAEGTTGDLAEIRKLIELLSESAAQLLDDTHPSTPVATEDRPGASVLLSYELTATDREGKRAPFAAEEFEVFMRTQEEFLRSPELWGIVSNHRQVRDLSVIRARKKEAGRWLREHLCVERPAKTALLRVTLVGDEPDEVDTILEVLVNVYRRQAQPEHSFTMTSTRTPAAVPDEPE